MPWSSNSALPGSVRNSLPSAAQTLFRNTANGVLSEGKSEQAAMRIAWSQVKTKWRKGSSGKWIKKFFTKPSSLYVSRKLLNAEEFISWAKGQGFLTTLQPGDLHVTVMYSKTSLMWPRRKPGGLIVKSSTDRSVVPLGDGGAIVLKFESSNLEGRWLELKDKGFLPSWPDYQPHITITWEAPETLDLSKVEPFTGSLIFGSEIFREVNEDWSGTITEKRFYAKFSGVAEELRMAFGWAMVSKVDGEDYYDLQDDHIPERALLEASIDFMQGDRIAGDMHTREGDSVKKAGSVIFAFPLISEAAEALGIITKQTGLIIGVKIEDDEVLKRVKDGTYTGFSIGGERVRDEEVE